MAIIDTPQRLRPRRIHGLAALSHQLDAVLAQENAQQGRELDLCEFAAQTGTEAGRERGECASLRLGGVELVVFLVL